MFVPYDEESAAQATEYVAAFDAGLYPARATGFNKETAAGQGGQKLVVTFEVWARAERGAPTRTVKAHFCLHHPKPQARGMFHTRLKQLGDAAQGFDPHRRGTDVAACIGKWVMVEVTKHEGVNKDGSPTFFNYIDGYARYRRPESGPAAPTAGAAAAPAPEPQHQHQPAYTPPAPAQAPQGAAGTDQVGYDPGTEDYDAAIPF